MCSVVSRLTEADGLENGLCWGILGVVSLMGLVRFDADARLPEVTKLPVAKQLPASKAQTMPGPSRELVQPQLYTTLHSHMLHFNIVVFQLN
jgi:hypothetical protein